MRDWIYILLNLPSHLCQLLSLCLLMPRIDTLTLESVGIELSDIITQRTLLQSTYLACVPFWRMFKSEVLLQCCFLTAADYIWGPAPAGAPVCQAPKRYRMQALLPHSLPCPQALSRQHAVHRTGPGALHRTPSAQSSHAAEQQGKSRLWSCRAFEEVEIDAVDAVSARDRERFERVAQALVARMPLAQNAGGDARLCSRRILSHPLHLPPRPWFLYQPQMKMKGRSWREMRACMLSMTCCPLQVRASSNAHMHLCLLHSMGLLHSFACS